MKKLILLFLSAVLFSLPYNTAVANDIEFEYDASGNCILKRKTVVLSKTKSMQNATDISQIEEVETDKLGRSEISILPNPTKGILKIEITGENPEGTFELMLSNVAGKRMQTASFSDNSYVLDMTSYPAGIYILRLKQGKEVMEWKIIKE